MVSSLVGFISTIGGIDFYIEKIFLPLFYPGLDPWRQFNVHEFFLEAWIGSKNMGLQAGMVGQLKQECWINMVRNLLVLRFTIE